MFGLFGDKDSSTKSNPKLNPAPGSIPGTPYWQLNRSMKDRMTALLEQDFMSDVVFLVLERNEVKQITTATKDQTKKTFKRFPAHRLILAISSPVFDTMFNSVLGQCKEIDIPDIEPAAFKVILKSVFNVTVFFC